MSRTALMSAAFDRRESRMPVAFVKPEWSPLKDSLLEAVYRRHGAKVAAEALCMSERQVINRAHLLGIKSAKNTKYTLEFCHELLDEWTRKSSRQIAKERGMTKSMVDSCILRAKRRPLV